MVMQVKPAGTPGEAKQVGFYPVDVPTLDKELLASMAALRRKYGQYVADNWIYAGFSRGAFLGASIVTLHPDKFHRAILIEGGQSAWNDANAANFTARGGKRVLFACGQSSCVDESNPAATLLKNHKADTRVVIGQGEGHGYKRQVKEQLKANFDWVVEGDPAWEH
jgi:predicted esterase